MFTLHDITFLWGFYERYAHQCHTQTHKNLSEAPELTGLIDYMESTQCKPADVRPAGHMSPDTSADTCDLAGKVTSQTEQHTTYFIHCLNAFIFKFESASILLFKFFAVIR